MSAIAIWSIHCNGRDCDADHRIPGNDAESLSEINADVRALGWLVTDRGRRHLCPDCAVKSAAMKEPGRIVEPMRLDELERICRESREAAPAGAEGGADRD